MAGKFTYWEKDLYLEVFLIVPAMLQSPLAIRSI